MIKHSQIEITNETCPISLGNNRYDSIRYHIKVAHRNDSGFGTLVKRSLDGQEFIEILPQLIGLKSSDVFAQIMDFFPNGYSSYPQQSTKRDEKRMRQGIGSSLLEKMLQDAEKKFSARAIGAFRCYPSFASFLEKKGFAMIYSGAYYRLL